MLAAPLIKAMGGKLEIRAVSPDGDVCMAQFFELTAEKSKRSVQGSEPPCERISIQGPESRLD